MTPLRAGVIGVGHLGQHHARLYAALPEAQLIGVTDQSVARARTIADRHGVRVFLTADELLPHVDVVSVAVPTSGHYDVAKACLQAGRHVLIEKPIAATPIEAQELVQLAKQRGCCVQVGHSERFNPVMALMRPYIGQPVFIECHRLSSFSERGTDVDVVLDLMIHDLDVLLATVGSEVESVEAVGVNVLTPRVDIANARLRFASGCVANVTASRISRARVRKARFFQHDAYISIDYAAQELEVYRLAPHPSTHSTSSGSTVSLVERSTGARGGLSTVEGQNGSRPTIQGGRIEIESDEPLRRELDDFICAVRDRRPPVVTGRDGRAALALANRIAELISKQGPVASV